MSLKRFIAGEKITKIPVNTWGAFADTAERQHDMVPGDRAISERSALRVRVYNNTDEDIPAGGVVKLGLARFNPAIRESVQFELPVINGELPVASEPFAISQGPIAKEQLDGGAEIIPNSGGIGRVAVRGITWARVNVISSTHVSCNIDPGNVASLITPGNTPILWKPTGTGILTCLVDLSPSTWIRRATVTESGLITAGGSGEVTYEGGETDTAYLDWLHGGQDITETIKVWVSNFHEDGKRRIICADCEPEAVGAPPGDGDSITASATQTRGEEPLTHRVNRVTTIATDNDVVTLPSAFVQGDDCFITNADSTGSNTLQIFPAGASDTINGGSPAASETLAFGLSVRYFLVRTGHWVS